MPVTILNPHRSEPWAHAVQGLGGALEAFQRYKSDERDHKLKLEEAKLRREESEQRRKERDQDMAYREQQLQWQARAEKDKEDERSVRQEQERIGLGESLGIAEDAADLGALIKETTSTGFVTPPPIDTTPGIMSKTEIGAALQPGPPSALIKTSPDAGLFQTAPIAPLGQDTSAPLEHLVAPQLEPKTETLAKNMAATEAEFATPTGALTARERALGRKGIEDTAFRREVGELERRESVQDKRLAAREEASDKRQGALFKQQSQLREARDRAAERRAGIAQSAAAAKNAEKVGAKLRLEYTKDINKPRERYRAIERGLSMGNPATPTATSDYSLVYAFAKASDPESAVREGEFQGIKTNIGGWNQQAQQYWRDIVDGKMTPQKRQEMVATIQSGLDYEKKTMEGIESHYRNLADVEDVDAARIFGKSEPKPEAGVNGDPGGILTDEEKEQNRQKTGNTQGLVKPPRR